MPNSRDIIKNYYDLDPSFEWSRLERHPFEFAITTRMMDPYIQPNDSILDIGGGPGRYSLHYLAKDHPVTLTDLSQGNIDFALSQSEQQKLPLEALACDALQIDQFITDKFDHVFLMGPLYHLMEQEERTMAVKLALSLLKPGGFLYASFLLMFSGVIFMLREAESRILDEAEKVWLNAVKNEISWGGDAFTRAFFIDQDQILPFMKQFDLEILNFFGQEGILSANLHTLLQQPEHIQKKWIDLSVELCEIPKYLSHSEHAMVIARKPSHLPRSM